MEPDQSLLYDNRARFGEHKTFFPKGAIAFFASMIVFYAAVWLAVYALMIHQQG
jgi:hypothetical protein